jgi:GH15 family glucan-1,4-alpha-glucosidase
MPRDLPVGNGQMLVNFDHHYRLRDMYYPHVGQENHGGQPCRFGVWASLPQRERQRKNERRKQRTYWSDDGWDLDLRYEADTLATQVRMHHPKLRVRLTCSDVVDFHRPVLVRRIEVHNEADEERDIRLIHNQDFHLYGTKVGDTAYYDPKLRSLVHYRKHRYMMAAFYADGEQRVDEYATGTAGFQGAEGTWRDGEDGQLGNNPIAQGAVDSTMLISTPLPAGQTTVVHMVIGFGQAYEDLQDLHRFLHREGPQGVVDRTRAYWRLWLTATRTDFLTSEQTGLSDSVTELFKRSLLVVRSQIDNNGSIIAANDSDIMQFSRDTYSYNWPRDGAFIADALDSAGFPDVSRSFYALCSRLLTDEGYFLHKYNPDGSPASSWHPWVADGRTQLPIQEDETALVLWTVWRHYVRYRDIEFVRPLWIRLIQPAADFLVRYRDPATNLPLPSYDLWEERWGVHAFTVASVYAGLDAARQFAECFGDEERAETYRNAAEQVQQAFTDYMWSEAHDYFLRRVVPADRDRTAFLIGEVAAGRNPYESTQQLYTGLPGDGQNGDGQRWAAHQTQVHHEPDAVIDSSLFAIFAMNLLPADDPRVVKTMQAVEQRLWVKTEVGGLARYTDDHYHQVANEPDVVPGNPWFICTLWLADYYIARAEDAQQLRQAAPLLEWVAERALPSGCLAEQVHPHTNEPLSVCPLTWSHATVVATLVKYLNKLSDMTACPTCGQPQMCVLPESTITSRPPMHAAEANPAAEL